MKRLVLPILMGAGSALFATPPYMWYATYSINNYSANGSNYQGYYWGNLGTCHADADGFSAAVTAHNPPNARYNMNRRDAAVTAATWTGVNAEVNSNDFVFYAGHGWDTGPFFGGNAGYPISSITDIRFGGGNYLKWVQAAACEWVEPSSQAHTGLTEWSRWYDSFQGVHSVMAHRAVTYDHAFSNQMSTQFWDWWKDNGRTIWDAWANAQIYWVYQRAGNPGLQPAIMFELGMDYESWASAGDAQAQKGYLSEKWKTVGTPEY